MVMNSNWFKEEKLHFAVQEGNLAQIKILIQEGRDINQFDDLGNTALHYAVAAGYTEITRLLLDSGANVNAHDQSRMGNTLLGDAVENCSFETTKMLIESGADPTIPGWMQITPLDKAKNSKKDEGIRVYRLLLEASKKFQK